MTHLCHHYLPENPLTTSQLMSPFQFLTLDTVSPSHNSQSNHLIINSHHVTLLLKIFQWFHIPVKIKFILFMVTYISIMICPLLTSLMFILLPSFPGTQSFLPFSNKLEVLVSARASSCALLSLSRSFTSLMSLFTCSLDTEVFH